MSSATDSLDRLIDVLGGAAPEAAPGGDAIDEVLGSPPRVTEVRSLRDHPDVVQFRQDLIDGLVRVDTVNRLLGLLSTVLTAVLNR